MDIIPFYYQNGQLEALSSMHQCLQAQGTTSVWTNGLNEAIARERVAIRATSSNSDSKPKQWTMASFLGMINLPSGIFPTQQRSNTSTNVNANGLNQLSNTRANNALGKTNRRRKAAIIARCAASSAGSVLSTSIGSATTDTASPAVKRSRKESANSIGKMSLPSKNEGTEESESDEESDVEVLEMDDEEFEGGTGDLLFGGTMNSLEERQRNDDPKVAQWRASFESAITERYRNKCRRRNMLCRRMFEFNMQRLKATDGVDLSQLSLTDLRIREKYAATVDATSATGQLQLVHRDTGRVFICLEDMFDVLSQFHTERGHGGGRKAMYVEARKRFANVSKEIVREYLRGCEWCTTGREGNGWGGRRVKGAGRGSGRGMTSRRTPRATAIVDGLSLRQYFDRMEQKQKVAADDNGKTTI